MFLYSSDVIDERLTAGNKLKKCREVGKYSDE